MKTRLIIMWPSVDLIITKFTFNFDLLISWNEISLYCQQWQFHQYFDVIMYIVIGFRNNGLSFMKHQGNVQLELRFVMLITCVYYTSYHVTYNNVSISFFWGREWPPTFRAGMGLVIRSLQCRHFFGTQVNNFILGLHLGFGNCGGLQQGTIC